MYLVCRGRRYNCDNRTVMLNGVELHRVQITVHLDHYISTDDEDNLVSAAIEQFWKDFNMFMADFGMLCMLIVIFLSYIAVHIMVSAK